MAIYLITGIAGFVGSALGKALLSQGHQVVGVDNFSSGTGVTIPPGVQFILGDCHKQTLYDNELPRKQYEAIFHLAGQNSSAVSANDPLADLQLNVESTVRLLQFAYKMRCKRFIYASDMSVYGDYFEGPVDENAPLNPVSFKGVSKCASEQYLRIYSSYGISHTILRLFDVFGPGQPASRNSPSMVASFIDMLVHQGHIHVKGSPNRFRDFVFIDDVVTCFLQCLRRPESQGKTINVAGSGKMSIGELIEKICRISGIPATVEYSGCVPGDIRGLFADLSNAARYLDYEPSVGLDEGLLRTYQWCLAAKQFEDSHAAKLSAF